MDIVIVLLLIVFNGVLALSEMAIVSARKIRLQQWADEQQSGAKMALELAQNPSRFLSTVQVGITVIGVLNGAFGEEALTGRLTSWMEATFPQLPHAHTIAFSATIMTLTFISLLFGELIPKRLALRHPEAIALWVGRPMNFLARLASPVVRFLMFCTDTVVHWIAGAPSAQEDVVTEEEIKGLMDQGAQAGIFDASEHALVHRVFSMDDRTVASAMTLRINMECLDIQMPVSDMKEAILKSPFSRFPVFEGEEDNIIGILHSKQLLSQTARGEAFDVRKHLIKPLFVPSTVTLTQLLETFKIKKQNMALVINEYGSIEGFITLIDVVEALMGDMVISETQEDTECVLREDGSWWVDGLTDISKVKSVLQWEALNLDEIHVQSIGGWVMQSLGRLPKTGDIVHAEGFDLEVVDMDSRRVDKLWIRPVQSPLPSESASMTPAENSTDPSSISQE